MSAPDATSQRAVCFTHVGFDNISSILSVLHLSRSSDLLYCGQCSRICRTVCERQPHGHSGDFPGTWMAASHAFKPIISVRIRNSAVASAFVNPAYSLRGLCAHGVFHASALRRLGSWLIVFSHLSRHTRLPQCLISCVLLGGRCFLLLWLRRLCVVHALRLPFLSSSSSFFGLLYSCYGLASYRFVICWPAWVGYSLIL